IRSRLLSEGFYLIRKRGSHEQWFHPDGRGPGDDRRA
ncbi:MAG: type II toxin-antitoxin system HicA family toxin, partial [Candidatus Eremiobacteraeota bacterium]|nr:type II toxin-antitoxin system HicA family toxin [Candidatus Eremiobacteraeota bacterium]